MALIKCPECGATISDKANACPTCGCPKEEFRIWQENSLSPQSPSQVPKIVDVEAPANVDKSNAGKNPAAEPSNGCIIAFLMCGLVFIFLIVVMARSCGNDNSPVVNNDSVLVDTVAYTDSASIAADENEKNVWKYSEEKDELTGKTTYFAQLASENYTTFDFPYNNFPIYLTLCIRKSPRYGTDVYLTIPEGQFHTNYNGTYISVRFDNGKVVRYSCSEPSDNSSTTLFVNGANGFIKKLKSSNECRISVEFYQEGSPTFTFKTKGLEWSH